MLLTEYHSNHLSHVWGFGGDARLAGAYSMGLQVRSPWVSCQFIAGPHWRQATIHSHAHGQFRLANLPIPQCTCFWTLLVLDFVGFLRVGEHANCVQKGSWAPGVMTQEPFYCECTLLHHRAGLGSQRFEWVMTFQCCLGWMHFHCCIVNTED